MVLACSDSRRQDKATLVGAETSDMEMGAAPAAVVWKGMYCVKAASPATGPVPYRLGLVGTRWTAAEGRQTVQISRSLQASNRSPDGGDGPTAYQPLQNWLRVTRSGPVMAIDWGLCGRESGMLVKDSATLALPQGPKHYGSVAPVAHCRATRLSILCLGHPRPLPQQPSQQAAALGSRPRRLLSCCARPGGSGTHRSGNLRCILSRVSLDIWPAALSR